MHLFRWCDADGSGNKTISISIFRCVCKGVFFYASFRLQKVNVMVVLTIQQNESKINFYAYMFYLCNGLQTVQFLSIDTPGVTICHKAYCKMRLDTLE